jgi:hypothetical protein
LTGVCVINCWILLRKWWNKESICFGICFGYELKTVIVPIVLLHNFCCAWSKVGHDGIYELGGKGFLSNK